jgi:hypothetical protein
MVTRLIVIARTMPRAKRAARARGSRDVEVVAVATPRSLDRLRGVTANVVLSVDTLNAAEVAKLREALLPCFATSESDPW